jgi:hypothetical protein
MIVACLNEKIVMLVTSIKSVAVGTHLSEPLSFHLQTIPPLNTSLFDFFGNTPHVRTSVTTISQTHGTIVIVIEPMHIGTSWSEI